MMKKFGLKYILVLTIGLALSVLMWTALMSLKDRLTSNESIWGIFQGDMPTYLANARHTSPKTLHLSYSSPYDLSQTQDHYLVQLPITLLSFLQFTGLSDSNINLLLTILFGPVMFLSLFMLLEEIFVDRWMKWISFITISLGGGLAWLNGLVTPYLEFWSGIRYYERYYYFWFYNIFRNLMYPFELLYHVLFFIYLIKLIRKKWLWANLLLVLALLMNPFLALQMIAVHLMCALLDKQTDWKQKLSSLPLVILWGIYYQFLLPLSPVFKSMIQQHSLAYQKPQLIKDYFQAYGIASVAFLTLLDKKFFKKIRAEWKLVPVIVLAFVTLGLVHHTRIPFLPKLQPMHFERGYLFASLYILLFSWLRFSEDLHRLSKRFVQGLTLFALLISLPDNIGFIRDQFVSKPTVPLLIWNKDRDEVFNFISQLPPHQHILISDMTLSLQVSAKFNQQVFFGTHFTTPNFEERARNMGEFLNRQGNDALSPMIKGWGVDYLILSRADLNRYSIDASLWKKHFEVGEWTIYAKAR